MNMLAGSLAPDSGEALLDDTQLQAGSPRAALAAGIAAVHQSPMLFERMTWEENLALGGFDTGGESLDLAAVAARARALAAKLGFELPPAAPPSRIVRSPSASGSKCCARSASIRAC